MTTYPGPVKPYSGCSLRLRTRNLVEWLRAKGFAERRIYGFLGALYLERRNFDCAATTHMDGGVPCMSGRTVAYRTHILQDEQFTGGFTDEKWWFGQYQLNADDDNFITRWMVSHGWETYMQYHP